MKKIKILAIMASALFFTSFVFAGDLDAQEGHGYQPPLCNDFQL
jgi:hypothetical protein